MKEKLYVLSNYVWSNKQFDTSFVLRQIAFCTRPKAHLYAFI